MPDAGTKPTSGRQSKGIVVLPICVFSGIVLGTLIGAMLGNPAIGLAIGAGIGIGGGITVVAATTVFRSSNPPGSPRR